MNLLTNIFKIFTLKYTTPSIVIFPGFGMHPSNYKDIFPENSNLIYLDIWNDSQFENISKGLQNGEITPPGTPKYDIWISKIIEQCNIELQKNTKNKNKFIFFAHSIGVEICNELSQNSIATITYGSSKQLTKKVDVPTFQLLGTLDSQVNRKLEKWPKDFIPILEGNHFSCSNDEGIFLAINGQNLLICQIKRYTQINNNKSKMLIKNEIKNIIESLQNT